jgi:peptide deformylase
MSILKTARLGNPVLSGVAGPVPIHEIIGSEDQRLIRNNAGIPSRWLGPLLLAASQVHRSLQIVVIEELSEPEQKGGKRFPPQALINPSISSLSGRLKRIRRVVSAFLICAERYRDIRKFG